MDICVEGHKSWIWKAGDQEEDQGRAAKENVKKLLSVKKEHESAKNVLLIQVATNVPLSLPLSLPGHKLVSLEGP